MAKNRDFSKFPNAITVLDNGNVGIGTSTPLSLTNYTALEIKGTNAGVVAVSSNAGGSFGRMYSTGSLVYIGTSSNHPVVFDTNDTERMRITSAGNVGIGTTSPTTILTLSKPIDSSAYGSGTRMLDFMSYFPGFDVSTVKASIYAGVSSVGTLRTDNGYMAFMTANAGVLSERIRIETNGNVGIGTNNPNSEASATNLVVRGISGKTNGWVQSLSYDGLSCVSLYSGASQADNPAVIYLKDLRFGKATDSGTAGFVENMRLTGAGHLQVPNQPHFKYGIGDRTITSTVRFGTDWSFPVLTSRDSIDSSHFNKANGRFTAPVAGVYIFGCTIMRNGTAGTGPIDFQIVKNEPNPIGQSSSSTFGRGYAGSYSTDYQQTTIVVTIKLAANDYVSLDFSGNMSTYGDDSWFYGYLLG